MFTGIVEEVGTVQESRPRSEGRSLVIAARRALEGVRRGDSIAVDGCCLTVEESGPGSFSAFASSETLDRTILGGLRRGSRVNLERAMQVGGRLGGHIVQGHVDGLGKVARLASEGAGWTFEVELPPALLLEMVPKCSIAIQGVSLTVAAVLASGVSAAVIPETYENTSLRHLRAGSPVNVEADIIGKYVKRFVENHLAGAGGSGAPGGPSAPPTGRGLTHEALKRAGFFG